METARVLVAQAAARLQVEQEVPAMVPLQVITAHQASAEQAVVEVLVLAAAEAAAIMAAAAAAQMLMVVAWMAPAAAAGQTLLQVQL